MKIDLYCAEGYIANVYDSELNVIFTKWHNFTSRIHVRAALQDQLIAIEKYGVKVIIADASEAKGIPYPDDQDWFNEVLYPESRRLGLKLVICVMPKNKIARLGTGNWKYIELNFGVKYVEVATLDEALDLFSSFKVDQLAL